jgi:hypothetical protein
LLSSLPYAEDAPFDSYAKQHELPCLPHTRVDLLRKIFDWADIQDEQCIFWLNGWAGTGKSTIARTVGRKYFKQGRLGASFFFSRGGGDVGNAGKFVTSIAVQLASSVPTIYRFIRDAIAERRDVASKSLHDQWHQLVLGPLSKLSGNSCPSSYVLIVDALDECDDNNVQIIVQLLAEARSLKTVRLRIFMTSRPEISIQRGVYQLPETKHQDFVLHNISPATVNHDISIYLEDRLRLIRQERALEAGWPDEQVIRRLVQNASGLFIWAATACRFIYEGKKRQVIKNRLSSVLQSSGSVTEPEKHLNEIYITVLRHSIPTKFSGEEREELRDKLRHMLGSIVVLLSPLSTHSLSRLLYIPKEDIDETLEDLHAILDIPKDQIRPLRLHHPSFRDFLLKKERCGDLNFWVDEKQAHQKLTNNCIRLMETSLKQDICGVDTPGMLVTDVESSQVEHFLPPEIKYACLYWVQHLQKSGEQLYDDDQVHRFLQVHLLHWLEALSWIRKTSEAINTITSLESTALVSQFPAYYEHLADYCSDLRLSPSVYVYS